MKWLVIRFLTEIFSQPRKAFKVSSGILVFDRICKIHHHSSRFREKLFIMNSRINELHNDVDKMKIESHNGGGQKKLLF